MPEIRDECIALRFALPPLAVWAVSVLIFESVAFDLPEVTTQLTRALESAGAGSPAVEAGLRLLWAASLLLFTFAALSVLVYAVWLIRTQLSPRGRRLYAAVAVALCVASVGHAALSSETRNAFSMLYYFTRDALHACGCYSAAQLAIVDAGVTALNVLAAVVPPVGLVAGCSMLIVPRGDDAAALAAMERRMGQLKVLIAGGSALLVTGLVHQTLWQRWPVMLGGADPGLMRFVESMSIYWGVTYSLVIVAFYVPPAWLIGRRARAILGRDPALAGDEKPDAWLARRGLSRAIPTQIPQIAAMLAPLLAGPLGGSLAGIGGVAVPG